MSCKYIVQFSDEKGKHLQAIGSMVANETILEEKPIVSCQYLWNREYRYSACEHCLKPLETAEEAVRRLAGDSSISLPYLSECCPTDKSSHVPCPQGCEVRYCSRECCEHAWQSYHCLMCPSVAANEMRCVRLTQLAELWKSIHYPPETCNILLIARLLFSIKLSSNPSTAIDELNQFCSSLAEQQSQLVHKLLGEKFQENILSMRQLLNEIVNESSFATFFTESGFLSLLALLARNGQGIGTNAFSKWAENVERLVASNPDELERINTLIEQLYDKMDEVTGLSFLNNEGSGLFRLQSAANHSCDPNAQVAFPFNNHQLALQALRNIEIGEEITICYLDECMQSRSRHTRIKYLQENYLFTCKCSKCLAQANDPDVTSDEDGEDSDEDMLCDD